MAACVEHDGLRAYDAADPDRCPWCHCSWATINGTGYHSCEQGSVWRGFPNYRERVTHARRMRQEALEGSLETRTGLTKGDYLPVAA